MASRAGPIDHSDFATTHLARCEECGRDGIVLADDGTFRKHNALAFGRDWETCEGTGKTPTVKSP